MNLILRTLAGAGLAGAALAVTPALAQAPSPQTWFKVCAKQADVDVCNTQLQVIAQNGQLVTAVSLLDIKGKTNRKIFQVSVPPGRLLQPGIAMAIDGGEPQKVDYSVCFADRCIAEAELTDKLLASLKKGGALTLTSVNFQRQQNPVNVTLSGFTGAYDGEPIQQTDAEARQKEVEDWVAKNKAEFEKKILEAQEKAKTGG
jgi:invasion protein IalB